MIRPIPLPILLLLVAAGTARAQDDPVLPDLAPREVEITGELTIRFPSLRRQPLVGFNPPPRVPDVPESRRPYAEPYVQRRADLPPSPLREPAAPAVSKYSGGPRFDGALEVGAGLYAERRVLLDASSRRSSRPRWNLDAEYGGRSGFEPVTAAPGAAASYDLGRLDGRLLLPLGAWHTGGRVTGSWQRYALFAALPSAGAVSTAAPERESLGGRAELFLSRERDPVRLRLDGHVGAFRLDTDVFDPTVRVDPRTSRDEVSTRIHLGVEVGDSDRSLYADGSWAATDIDGGSPGSSDAGAFQASAGVRFTTPSGMRIRAGAAVIGFEALASATGAGRRAFTWLSPDFRIEASPHPRWRLSLQNVPHAAESTLEAVYREQPYAVDSAPLEAVLWPVDASARGTLALGRVELALSAGYRLSPNRRYYEHSTATFGGYARGISTVAYGRARELQAGVDVSTYLGAGIQARAGAAVRDGRLTDLRLDLPYFAPWTAFALFSAGFDRGRGVAQLTGRFEGSRARDTAGSLDLEPFGDVDVAVSYRVSRSTSAVVRLENLAGNRPEWDGYLRPSPLVTAGVLWQW